jgi:hypothetical protein
MSEAAERLREEIGYRAAGTPTSDIDLLLNDALAAAKAEESTGWRAMLSEAEKVCIQKIAAAKAEGAREAVERIRAALLLNEGDPIPEAYAVRVLDEENAR